MRTPLFCIIERANAGPLCLPMLTKRECRTAYDKTRETVGLNDGDTIDVFEGDPNGEGDTEPALIGWYSPEIGLIVK